LRSDRRTKAVTRHRTPKVTQRFPRSSGVLLHPTALPGRFGIGDLGDSAYRFADFLVASGQKLWQVLPLGPTGYGDSPYACYSAFAGNTSLISSERLVGQGLLLEKDFENEPEFPTDRVNFEIVQQTSKNLLGLAFDRFKRSGEPALQSSFQAFCSRHADWLDDYALFRALKDAHDGAIWTEWESEIVRREARAIVAVEHELKDQIEAQKLYQFLFFTQWFDLKSYCNQQGIRIIGDIPIFVALDSADVWTNPNQFKLDQAGRPTVVAGVPPDYFSETGQFWGNPIYNWEHMMADGFEWWIKRVRAAFQIFDIVRIDHFRGFAASWEIPGGDKTAERGSWVQVPGRALFTAIRNRLGELPIIAEDLGVITPDVEKLRDDLGFPGMRVLQFAFGGDATNGDLPHNYRRNLVVYTGTHDNDTTVGWFTASDGEGSTRLPADIERERSFCLRYLKSDGQEINWDFIRAAISSVADTAIIPLQDLLGLGNEARMNLPNSTVGNWTWRFRDSDLTDEIIGRLRALTAMYGR
jgi:4-alpha-glucanotransferase